MIGSFVTPAGEECILSDDLIWSCEDDDLLSILNDHYNPTVFPYCSPAAGEPGHMAVIEAAKAFDAEAKIEDRAEPAADGTIY